MLAGKLTDVPIEVLRADLVEGASVSALQHGPETLHSVRVRLASDVLADRVLDRPHAPA